MFEYFQNAVEAMVVAHQSGFNMLDQQAVRLYAAGWLAEKLGIDR